MKGSSKEQVYFLFLEKFNIEEARFIMERLGFHRLSSNRAPLKEKFYPRVFGYQVKYFVKHLSDFLLIDLNTFKIDV